MAENSGHANIDGNPTGTAVMQCSGGGQRYGTNYSCWKSLKENYSTPVEENLSSNHLNGAINQRLSDNLEDITTRWYT